VNDDATHQAIPLASEEERQPLPPVSVNEPFTITIFGATGDLSRRKLMPGLFAMYSEGLFHERFALVGFARREHDDASYREMMATSIREHSRVELDEKKLSAFLENVYYHRGDLTNPDSFSALRERYGDRKRYPANDVFYLAIMPELFEAAVNELERAGFVRRPPETPWMRVVVEKPFGHDWESARDLNQKLLRHLHESQMYRIDHYLGKETVQNMLSFRFANAIYEPIFNNRYVDHIQITASEATGMESGRGAYYDSAGALRDMVQNHMLQLLSFATMDPPSNLTAESIRNQKVEVLKSVAPVSKDDIRNCAVRGQYGGGEIDGERVPAYLEEERVAPDSRTATFVALQMNIENWRWAGVPVFLRTGKRLQRRVTEIAVQFKMPPLQLFKSVECEGDVCDLTLARPNVLVFRIQPDEGISMRFSAKRPAMQFVVESVAMDFSYHATWRKSLPEAYERLLLDVLRGDSTLFTRSDEVEAAWRVVTPFLRAWEQEPDLPLHAYDPGGWGPDAADELIRRSGREWVNPR